MSNSLGCAFFDATNKFHFEISHWRFRRELHKAAEILLSVTSMTRAHLGEVSFDDPRRDGAKPCVRQEGKINLASEPNYCI